MNLKESSSIIIDRQEVTGSNPVLPTSVNLIFYKEFYFLFAIDLQCD